MASKRGPFIVVFHGGTPGWHWHVRAAKTVVKRVIGGAPGLVLKFSKEASPAHGEIIRWTWIY